ncbi:Kinase-like protein [Mycena indigotica]|uniref:non-specific serine/threonine protein kinase n=1 Tax=Mycena indigotica TaxID=2126181 RepID=A0A8H6T813_9AGAR|nr:Kinase-like protein [Mycena indigotica]KAF7312758.1 Kinase-like protein [Mycena indigotica]
MELTRRSSLALRPLTTAEIQLALQTPLGIPAPGRVLHEAYDTFGRFAARHANRADHRLGLGPLAALQRVKDFFSDGREAKLEQLRTSIPRQVEKDCLKLLRYALPSESSQTQIHAFQAIITLSTLYPGLRLSFVSILSPETQNKISEDFIRKLWKRDDVFGQAQDFVFYLQFTTSCLTEPDISNIIERAPANELWTVESRDRDGGMSGLSVIEQLLVASDDGNSFGAFIALRYLTGIIECPAFWAPLRSQADNMLFDTLVVKICSRALGALQDIGLGVATARGDDNETEAHSLLSEDGPDWTTSDVEGVDAFCYAILDGLQDISDSATPQAFVRLLGILHHPCAKRKLPLSWPLCHKITRERQHPCTSCLGLDDHASRIPLVSRFRAIVSRLRQPHQVQRPTQVPPLPIPGLDTPIIGPVAASVETHSPHSTISRSHMETEGVSPPTLAFSDDDVNGEAVVEDDDIEEEAQMHWSLSNLSEDDDLSSEGDFDMVIGSPEAYLAPEIHLVTSRRNFRAGITGQENIFTRDALISRPLGPTTTSIFPEPTEPVSISNDSPVIQEPTTNRSLIVKLPSSAYKDATNKAAARPSGLSQLLRQNTLPASTLTGRLELQFEIHYQAEDDASSSSWETERNVYPPFYGLPGPPMGLEPASPLSPRAIRRRMVVDEVSESLREGLLWQRKMDRIANGQRRTNLWAGPIPNVLVSVLSPPPANHWIHHTCFHAARMSEPESKPRVPSEGNSAGEKADQLEGEEDLKDYKPGGYHPVKIGDLFLDGRYVIVRTELGWGRSSTVWLAWDSDLMHHVALKIVRAEYTADAKIELRILRHLSMTAASGKAAETDTLHPGRAHVVSLLNHFMHTGPNGTHVCLVLEALGENLLGFIQKHPSNGVPTFLVKQIAKQLLQGLHYMHLNCKVIHTDLKPENILVSLDIETVLHSQAKSSSTATPQPAVIIQSQPILFEQIVPENINVKIVGFGTAVFQEHDMINNIQTRPYRAPEVIVKGKWDENVDTWSLACIKLLIFYCK